MTELRTQSRLASLAESMANIILGILIQSMGQLFLFYVMHIPITGKQFILFTAVMTVLSVVRSYCLRRMWNAEWWTRFKRTHPDEPIEPPHFYNAAQAMDWRRRRTLLDMEPPPASPYSKPLRNSRDNP